MSTPGTASSPIHMIDLIAKKRDGGELDAHEIAFLVAGTVDGSIPLEQLAAWLMAARLRGLSLAEAQALTLAMRDSGDTFDPSRLGRSAVDKHSTGGVGDKTSLLVAPIAAACGVAVPMISGRALGHTGGTLDKLESIPGFRTALTLPEFEAVLARCGAAIVSQTPTLVPADRVLYALRDRTGTVESPGLICASILSKKLAAGLDALVLDVKTGSGAFLRDRKEADYLAALLVATAEAAGTRTVALMTDMGQPLGRSAGNWIEVAECVELLRGARPEGSEDLRELSLILAGWMIHLGGEAATPEAGYQRAEGVLADGHALRVFLAMVEAQGGDVRVFDDLEGAAPSGRNARCCLPGRAATWPQWIRPHWAGPCSGSAPAAPGPASPSIPTQASSSTPAAARTSKAASRSPHSTRQAPICWRMRPSACAKASSSRRPRPRRCRW